MKNIRFFLPSLHFLVGKFSVYLNRRVLVMNKPTLRLDFLTNKLRRIAFAAYSQVFLVVVITAEFLISVLFFFFFFFFFFLQSV